MNQTNISLNSDDQPKSQVFPRELLSKSPEERLRYFRNFTIAHPVLLETFEKLWRAVLDPQPGSTVLIYGPAGVGKTTLCDYLEKRIREKFAQLFESNREMIPLVRVEACNPVSGNFDWKHLFREILLGLCEPATGQKLDLTKWKSSFEEYQQIANNPRSACQILRDVVEEALKHRKPKGVLIDEAQHMCVMTSGRKLVNQPDSIKSVANRTETTHILFGSYDLLALRNLSGQLARRTIQLHFKRYDNQNARDVRIFLNILRQFQDNLPMEETIDLVDNWEFIYSRSIGYVGVLKEWFNRSLSMALDEKSSGLKMRHLTSSALSTSQAGRLLDEVLSGEKKIRVEEIPQEKLMSRLNFIKVIKPDGQVRNLATKKKSTSVGTRNPKRDKVGAKQYA
jgi:energy-coupling factor transporter ATP-binding protein EcfA2